MGRSSFYAITATFRKCRFVFSLVLVVLVLPCKSAVSDTIWLAGKSTPVFGIVVSTNEQSVVLSQTSDGERFSNVTIDKSEITSIVINYDVPRLSSLVYGDWEAWHRYAEELFSQKKDPVARTLCRRLRAIMVGNSKDVQLRKVALNELIQLSQSEEERNGLFILRYLETGQKRPSTNTDERKELPRPSQESRRSDREVAAKFVQSIRRGRNVDNQMDDSSLKSAVSAFENVCSWSELVQIAKSNRINANDLRRLVALEYSLRTADEEMTFRDNKEESWHLQASRISDETFSLPTIKSVTGFDPEATKFVDGTWKR